MTETDWLQVEQAAAGCIDGTSDDWPLLRIAIEKLTREPFEHRRTAQWLQGFCESAVNLRSDRFMPIFDILPRLWRDGYTAELRGEDWVLRSPDYDVVAQGVSFRGLCVNIVLAGL